MALLNCRECGAEISSDARQTKCKQCGALFPFECAVCAQPLRPPFPVFQDEKYLTDDNRPLCEKHYERLCPSCHKWFRADENPGYYLCHSCSTQRSHVEAAPTYTDDLDDFD